MALTTCAVFAPTRAKLPPVVILTSSGEESDIPRGYGLGANGYVRRPVDFVQFVEAAHRLGLYWLIADEPLPSGWGERG
jgi:two-component system response regulator